MRSKRDLVAGASRVPGERPQITEFSWNVDAELAQRLESLEEPESGQALLNGRVAAMNRRPPS